MQCEQLLPKDEVFQDQVLAGTKGANQPTQQMSEARDHGENLIELLPVEPVAKSFYLQMQDVLRSHNGQRYVDKGTEYYEERYRNQQIHFLRKNATKLGFQITEARA